MCFVPVNTESFTHTSEVTFCKQPQHTQRVEYPNTIGNLPFLYTVNEKATVPTFLYVIRPTQTNTSVMTAFEVQHNKTLYNSISLYRLNLPHINLPVYSQYSCFHIQHPTIKLYVMINHLTLKLFLRFVQKNRKLVNVNHCIDTYLMIEDMQVIFIWAFNFPLTVLKHLFKNAFEFIW